MPLVTTPSTATPSKGGSPASVASMASPAVLVYTNGNLSRPALSQGVEDPLCHPSSQRAFQAFRECFHSILLYLYADVELYPPCFCFFLPFILNVICVQKHVEICESSPQIPRITSPHPCPCNHNSFSSRTVFCRQVWCR